MVDPRLAAGALVAIVGACGRGGAPPTAARAPACLADRVPDPMPAQRNPAECRGREAECRRECSGGDAAACAGVAYVFEGSDRRQAFSFYGRGCVLGSATACTNYGAYLLNDESEASAVCATRLHRMTCDAADPWGCGMLGMALVRATGITRDVAAAEQVLRESCEQHGSFACDVLGMFTADGTFGPPDPDAAEALYRRACETGDPFACELVQPADGRAER